MMREDALEVGEGPEHEALYTIEKSFHFYLFCLLFLDFYLLCDGEPLKNLGERNDMLRFAWEGLIGTA